MSQITSFGSGGSTPGTLVYKYTTVITTPYFVQPTDEFLGVDTSTLAITIRLPDAPVTGRVYIIKDIADNARNRNITVTTVSGVVNIDGATSEIMNSDLQAINVLFNGTEYLIF